MAVGATYVSPAQYFACKILVFPKEIIILSPLAIVICCTNHTGVQSTPLRRYTIVCSINWNLTNRLSYNVVGNAVDNCSINWNFEACKIPPKKPKPYSSWFRCGEGYIGEGNIHCAGGDVSLPYGCSLLTFLQKQESKAAAGTRTHSISKG